MLNFGAKFNITTRYNKKINKKMNNEAYRTLRAMLVNDYYNLMKHKLWRSAKARVRKLAKLDNEQYGIDVEHTYELFEYYKIGRE